MWRVAAVLLLATLAACGDDGDDGGADYASPEAIAGALGCQYRDNSSEDEVDDLLDRPPSMGPSPGEEGRCEFEGETLYLEIYESVDALKELALMERTLGCQ